MPHPLRRGSIVSFACEDNQLPAYSLCELAPPAYSVTEPNVLAQVTGRDAWQRFEPAEQSRRQLTARPRTPTPTPRPSARPLAIPALLQPGNDISALSAQLQAVADVLLPGQLDECLAHLLRLPRQERPQQAKALLKVLRIRHARLPNLAPYLEALCMVPLAQHQTFARLTVVLARDCALSREYAATLNLLATCPGLLEHPLLQNRSFADRATGLLACGLVRGCLDTPSWHDALRSQMANLLLQGRSNGLVLGAEAAQRLCDALAAMPDATRERDGQAYISGLILQGQLRGG